MWENLSWLLDLTRRREELFSADFCEELWGAFATKNDKKLASRMEAIKQVPISDLIIDEFVEPGFSRGITALSKHPNFMNISESVWGALVEFVEMTRSAFHVVNHCIIFNYLLHSA